MKTQNSDPSVSPPAKEGQGEVSALMKKLTIKFPHTHEGTQFPAGSVIELPKEQADWLLAQRIDDQPCAVPYTGSQPAANKEISNLKSQI